MVFRFFGLFALAFLCLSLYSPVKGFSEEGTAAAVEKKEVTGALAGVVEQTLGKGARIIKVDPPTDAPIPHWKQTRVWVASVYGETPVLFYSRDDGSFMFAGSIFNPSGENLTKRDVGETIPKVVDDADMQLNEDYMFGKKEAPVKAVLWLGADRYSKELFQFFYGLYRKNEDKVALYIKFYPSNPVDAIKMEAITCFKKAALEKALEVIYNAAPSWGSKEDIAAFKKTGDSDACKESLVLQDLNLAAKLGLPQHPVVFINGTMLIVKATRENIMQLSGVKLD